MRKGRGYSRPLVVPALPRKGNPLVYRGCPSGPSPQDNVVAQWVPAFAGKTVGVYVVPAQAGIHWFTVVGRLDHRRKTTSSRSGFRLSPARRRGFTFFRPTDSQADAGPRMRWPADSSLPMSQEVVPSYHLTKGTNRPRIMVKNDDPTKTAPMTNSVIEGPTKPFVN